MPGQSRTERPTGTSGAPTFFDDTLLLAGIQTWGDSMGVAMGDRARLDTASALAFLDDYVTLP
jgi:hypothetical protein